MLGQRAGKRLDHAIAISTEAEPPTLRPRCVETLAIAPLYYLACGFIQRSGYILQLQTAAWIEALGRPQVRLSTLQPSQRYGNDLIKT